MTMVSRVCAGGFGAKGAMLASFARADPTTTLGAKVLWPLGHNDIEQGPDISHMLIPEGAERVAGQQFMLNSGA